MSKIVFQQMARECPLSFDQLLAKLSIVCNKHVHQSILFCMRMIPIDLPNTKEISDCEKGVTSRKNEWISQGQMVPVTLLLCDEGERGAG